MKGPNGLREPASTTEVPPFALFEFSALQPVRLSRANNAKGGTCVIEVATRTSPDL